MNPLRKSVMAALLGGGAIGGALVATNVVRDASWARAEQKVENTRQELATVNDLSNVFRNVSKVVEPSVVNINIRKTIKGQKHGLPFDDDLLKRFLPNRGQGNGPGNGPGNGQGNEDNGDGDAPQGQDAPDGSDDMEQVGTGSGVIMEVEGKTGYILTNNHVAGGASEILVTLSDGRRIENCKLVGADPKSDMAVVKIEAEHLIPAKWGDSSTLEKGDWILAFGSPFGYVGSMTHGIVSALDRSQVGILGAQGYEDFIQVDAPINPGNSGGPLVNLHGEVVGINTAIASRSGGFQGIGFAIPSNEAKFVYTALKAKGKVTRGWLGVSISDVARDPAKAHSFGYTGDTGVLVEQTFPNTPATGKLQAGDIVEEMDGKPVHNVLQLRNGIAATAPGTDLHLKVFREGKDQEVLLKLGEQPEDLLAVGRTGTVKPPAPATEGTAEAMGMKLATPDDTLAQKFSLNDREGAVVTGVAPKSQAAKAGIRPGDLITRVAGEVVSNAKQASDALSKQDSKKGVRLYITNPEGSRFVFIPGSEG